MRTHRALNVLLPLVLLSHVAAAHDYWLTPDRLRVAASAEVALSLWVGDDFVAEEERAWQRTRTTRFQHLSARLVRDLSAVAVEGARPIVRERLPTEGGHLFVMERSPARIELAPARFEAYLHEEGLDAIVAERARRGEQREPGRERYVRALKSLVQVGAARDNTYATATRSVIELVPRQDPTGVRVGAPLTVQLLFREHPLPGATVEALARVGRVVTRQRAVSDAAGNVTFTLDRRGAWLLRAVHMERAPAGADVDWLSFWTSYSFGLCTSATSSDCVTPPMLGADAGVRDAGAGD